MRRLDLSPPLSRNIAAVLASACVAFALLAATGMRDGEQPFARLENPLDLMALDLLARAQRVLAPRAAASDPVIIGVDEDTLAAFPEPRALWHPHLGALIAAVARSGAAAFGVHTPLPDRLYDALVPGIDATLLGPIAEARERLPLVFARTADAAGAMHPVHPDYVAAAGGQQRFGFGTLSLDPDGLARRFDDRRCSGDPRACTFAGLLATETGLRQRWSGYIPYGLGDGIRYVPMREVLRWAQSGSDAGLANAFRGRTVLLGFVLQADDRVMTPLALADKEPARTSVPQIMVHAQVLRAMLNPPGLLLPAPAWLVAGLGLLAALCATGSARVARKLLVAAYLLLAAIVAVVSYDRGVVLPVASLALAAIAAGPIGALLDRLFTLNMQRRLTKAFEGSLDHQLVRSVESGTADIGADADYREAAVLVCRLAGAPERVPPAALALSIDAQFARIGKVVRAHGGHVEAFAGDTVTASFGAFLSSDRATRAALESAQEILTALARLREEMGDAAPLLSSVGIGIAAGVAFVGRLGTPGRTHWHVLGGIIDRATALQAQAGAAGVPILCSAEVTAAVGHPGMLIETALGDGTHAYAWTPEPWLGVEAIQ